MARVLIAGCGDVGTRLGLILAAAGHAVWGLRRHPQNLPAPIQPLAADLHRGSGLDALPCELDAVVCMTAADDGSEAAYQRAYLEAPAQLLATLAQRGEQPRLLFASSTSVYGQDDGDWVDETSLAAADTPTARIMRRAEAQWLDGGGWRSVLRFGGIYGPGRTWLIEQVRRGGKASNIWSNRIHAEDAARAAAHVLALAAPEPTYNVVDDSPAPLPEVYAWLGQRLGVTPPPSHDTTVASRRGSKRVSNRRLRASGFELLYPSYRDGYADMLE